MQMSDASLYWFCFFAWIELIRFVYLTNSNQIFKINVFFLFEEGQKSLCWRGTCTQLESKNIYRINNLNEVRLFIKLWYWQVVCGMYADGVHSWLFTVSPYSETLLSHSIRLMLEKLLILKLVEILVLFKDTTTTTQQLTITRQSFFLFTFPVYNSAFEMAGIRFDVSKQKMAKSEIVVSNYNAI